MCEQMSFRKGRGRKNIYLLSFYVFEVEDEMVLLIAMWIEDQSCREEGKVASKEEGVFYTY